MSERFGGEMYTPRFEDEALLRHPREVFDSPYEPADKSANKFSEDVERATRWGDMSRVVGASEIAIESTETPGSKFGHSIYIAWPSKDGETYALQLQGLKSGKGIESGVQGYLGAYGTAERSGDSWKLIDANTVEDIWGVPRGLKLIIRPTVARWAVGRDIYSEVFGENYRTLFVGLGFLLLGHQWMHLGTHEAGHLPEGSSERQAWTRANRLYASRHRDDKYRIIDGESDGMFDLLQRPNPYDFSLTIGNLTRASLMDSFIGGERVPQRWRLDSMDFRRWWNQTTQRAQEAHSQAFL